MGVAMRVEAHFHQQDECSVFLETTLSGDAERNTSVFFFCLFAARQLVTLGPDAVGQSLAAILLTIREITDRLLAGEIGQDARLVDYAGSPGRKRFVAELHDNGRFFLKGKGLGLLGSGAGYYAPTSVLALLSFLLRRNSTAPITLEDLLNSAGLCGAEFLRGNIRFRHDSAAAMQIAAAASLMTQETSSHEP